MSDETGANAGETRPSLLTNELRERLLANGRKRDTDHIPVIKFINPVGTGLWLASELDADGDTLFGVADLGEPELGLFSLAELESLLLPLRSRIERDPHFVGHYPVSIYAEAARSTASLAEGIRLIGIIHALRRGDE
ncbi:DUF2958 domain-containing protein [Bosea sp. MMO-172]|uniref:DUF2958 domain-containing protein n=1 Tax=Bosea sp. MMO-172 TaxID=3127885 RepID=UPI00301B484A